ncbi:ABC transporter permease [Mobilicoccus caccae]|uniref:ABC transporter permease n=1 Tax=Mobilicoccus caccae TaxID=1859295 RepID=A0ABQ6IYG1_9MICO|nr:ABC transporter permease [Mobilicoccus caccae]GMA41737.1 ABC transporter permease [Mobilicoccus caccae]
MNASLVRNEFAKLAHLHVGTVGAMLVLAVLGMTLLGIVSAGADQVTWPLVLASLSRGMALASPLLIAIVASRSIEIEHQGNGWLLNQSAGTDRGRLCRAKLLTTGVVITGVTVVAILAVAAVATLLGATSAAPVGLLAGYALAATVANLVVLALHVVLSARLENQLIPLGIGIVGTVVALMAEGLPSWAAHATPWGYYALIAAGRYQGGEVVTLTPSYVSVLVLGAIAIAVFALITRRIDRQEA